MIPLLAKSNLVPLSLSEGVKKGGVVKKGGAVKCPFLSISNTYACYAILMECLTSMDLPVPVVTWWEQFVYLFLLKIGNGFGVLAEKLKNSKKMKGSVKLFNI